MKVLKAKWQTITEFAVNGLPIRIEAKARTHLGNFAGWWFRINGVKIYKYGPDLQAAMDNAYAQWVQNHAPVPVDGLTQ